MCQGNDQFQTELRQEIKEEERRSNTNPVESEKKLIMIEKGRGFFY